MAYETILFLFLAAFLAGWIDSIAGGGGLITVPSLLLSGLDPATAIATNKLQSSFGTFTAASYFLHKGLVSIRSSRLALLAIFIGSSTGTLLLLQINADFLITLIPILLLSIGCYYLFFAKNLDAHTEPRLSEKTYVLTAAPTIGFYDGFFGPGTGSFFTTSLVLLRGMTLKAATAHAKLFNFMSNASALTYFILFGAIAWLPGIAMIAGQIIGAYFGARTAFIKGSKIIKPLTVGVCFAMSAKILWSAFS